MDKKSAVLQQNFADLSLIYEEMLSHLDYLHIYALNYYYIDFKTNTITVSGTEADWMVHMLEQGLHQDIAMRLKEYGHEWHKNSRIFQVYQDFMRQGYAGVTWQKTDYCLKNKHGMHLLEIGHTKPLGIDTTHQLNDAIDTFKHETNRLRKKFPDLTFSIAHMADIQEKQEQFAKEEQDLMDSMKIEFDMSLFEPLPEPVLTEKEDQALSLRVRWYEDDEIADEMQCTLKDIKDLFQSIKEKYHQPKIPQRVYVKKRKQLFPELFSS